MSEIHTSTVELIKSQNKFLSKVYAWMTLALTLSAFAAFFASSNSTALNFLYGNRYTIILLCAIELGLVWIMSMSINKLSSLAAGVMFIVYSIINGLTISGIFIVYSKTSIYTCFFISAGLFFTMSFYGAFTKTNLNSVGKYLFMALIGIIIASIVNIFLKSTSLNWLISIITVVLFTGLTAYDTQKIMAVNARADDSDMFKKASIICALNLYIDFINIFLAMLRLFGRSRD